MQISNSNCLQATTNPLGVSELRNFQEEHTRNLKVEGINPFCEINDLYGLFENFGALHVFDTQFLAQGTVIVSYFDIRNAAKASLELGKSYKVKFLKDAQDEDYLDYVVFHNIENLSVSEVTHKLGIPVMQCKAYKSFLFFRFFDRRDAFRLRKALFDQSFEVRTLDSFKPETPLFRPLNTNVPSSSQFVINLQDVIMGRDKRTTVMIRNIPNKYSQTLLVQTIEYNHAGNFDFLYLPIDFKNKCNVGYAFINFVDYKCIPAFYYEFVGKPWPRFNSEKICALTYARIQGREALAKHFRNSNIMQFEKRMRPIVFGSNLI